MAALAVTAVSGCAAEDGVIDTEAGKIKFETVAKGLAHPWGLAFLPDGSFLVTERQGRLRLVSKTGEVSKPLTGVPEVFAEGQGGLLDVALDRDFASNRLVYLSYSEPGEGGAGTAVARGKLADGGLENLEVIFRQEPKVGGGNHFGSRLAFAPDGKLFITLGERFTFTPAQDLSNDLGKIVRMKSISDFREAGSCARPGRQAVGLGDQAEVRIVVEDGAAVVAVEEEFLPLADHAEAAIVENENLDGQLQLGQKAQFLDSHLEAAVAAEQDRRAVGCGAEAPMAAGRPKPIVPRPPEVMKERGLSTA